MSETGCSQNSQLTIQIPANTISVFKILLFFFLIQFSQNKTHVTWLLFWQFVNSVDKFEIWLINS
ncbi:hypothetical protein F8388_019750 [Cannabis sativa]|uniref:Uncharacterized protein n=1 Tax=Cannabis sativa TaxID=3483 RepID=A0A7J6EVK4_CANSA|nr:hypothetical protein F8388_019750 [Cannabis sativa]